MTLSVIIPAFNEESYMAATLSSVGSAVDHLLQQETGCDHVEIIVVDNGSEDRTAEIARSLGATVVAEPRGNVAVARNAGGAGGEGRCSRVRGRGYALADLFSVPAVEEDLGRVIQETDEVAFGGVTTRLVSRDKLA